MMVIVDTCVWSLVLRRKKLVRANPYVQAFEHIVQSGNEICLLGQVLQELLDGVSESQFDKLKEALAIFPICPLSREVYVKAAWLRNQCRISGVQASLPDFLIAGASIELGYPLLTYDQDFFRIANLHPSLTLMPVQ